MIIKVLIKVFEKNFFVLLSEKFFILIRCEKFFPREKICFFLKKNFRSEQKHLSKNKKSPAKVSSDEKKIYLREKNFPGVGIMA